MPDSLFIDFEASCLPRDGRSFPIEVGLADGAGWSCAWLIRPVPAWADWTWADEAEALHGIDRATLERDGRSAIDVLTELNAIARGRDVIADHDFDRLWLATLADAAGRQPAFGIRHIAELVDCTGPDDTRRAVAVANTKFPIRHRARFDALWLATFAASLPTMMPPPLAA
jgi:hypothetical protein